METSLPNCGDAFSHKEILGERAAKLFAFWAIVAATVAAISAAVALPALYSTTHRLRAELSRESDFCRLQVRDFWLQMYALGVPLDATLNRLKRDTGADDKQNESALKRRKRGWLFGTWRNDDDAAIGVNSDPYGGGGDSGSRANDGYGGMGGGTSRKNGYDSAPSGYGSSAGDNVEVGLHIVREGLKSSATYDAFPIYGGASPPGASPPSISPPAGVAAARPQFVARTTPVCPCQCQQGPPGPAGEPGDDGKAGADGRAGAPGDVGRHGQLITPLRDAPKEPCIICPVGPPGPPGGQGPRGPTGPRGTAGTSGIDGRRGEPGMQGPPGPIGVPGVQGPQGPQGIAGRQFMRDGSRGPAGKSGPPGPKGLQGCQGTPGGTVVGDKGAPGDPGRPGHDGHKGVQGPDGLSGPKGISGDCQHCPIPRTPPGY